MLRGVTLDDEQAVDALLNALDELYDGKLAPAKLRTMMQETKIDSAELAAHVRSVALSLEGILRIDARIAPPYDERYATALASTAALRSLLADLYDEIWARRRRW